MRAIPGLTVFRPGDANETAAAWRLALERSGPSAFALTRQNLVTLDPADVGDGVAHGGYTLKDADGGQPQVILLATGSEVQLAMAARTTLSAQGVATRVVSMPSWELWNEQSPAYRADVLPCDVPKLVIEAGCTQGWRGIIGDNGDIIGIDRFGESAPGDVVMEKFGFNVENVIAKATALVTGKRVQVEMNDRAAAS